MASGAISFLPSNLHSCSINCLEIDVADLKFAWETLRQVQSVTQPWRGRQKNIIILWDSGNNERVKSAQKVYVICTWVLDVEGRNL